jgi:hypothetical protein
MVTSTSLLAVAIYTTIKIFVLCNKYVVANNVLTEVTKDGITCQAKVNASTVQLNSFSLIKM